jgi:hypothetical protein
MQSQNKAILWDFFCTREKEIIEDWNKKIESLTLVERVQAQTQMDRLQQQLHETEG